ncbi:MAG: protein-glutamine glutaminase family protein [Gemmataceae bacterium]
MPARLASVLLVGLLLGSAHAAPPTDRPRITFVLPGNVSVVSPERAAQLFKDLQADRDIAHRYPIDGCYARAHLMGRRLAEVGITPGKIWAFDDRAMDDKKSPTRLRVRTPNHPAGTVAWRYHVAPILGVREASGRVRTHVFDPSLFGQPVPVARWLKRMVDQKADFIPRIDLTAWGEAPRRLNGSRYAGQGYWPGADPGVNLDSVARLTMIRYLPLQGSNRTLVVPRGAPVAMVVEQPQPPAIPDGTRK